MRTTKLLAQLTAALGLAALLASGCDGRSLEDDLRARIVGEDMTFEVELGCASCPARVDVDVYFAADASLTMDDEVVLEQYRVDYDLAGVDGVPFFAGVLEQHVRMDDDASFTVTLAGSAQREHVASESPDDDVEGRATITLAGYDSDEAQVFVEKEIAIRFVHASSAEEPTP